MGLACAACHTGQLNDNKIACRVDGGSGRADMENFIGDLSGALDCVQKDCQPAIRVRFVKNVLARGNYSSEKEVLDDVSKWPLRIAMYYIVNEPIVNGQDVKDPVSDSNRAHYGYARLDAFGRIFNKVPEYPVDSSTFTLALPAMVGDPNLTLHQLNTPLPTPHP